jgi:hypothetical protein
MTATWAELFDRAPDAPEERVREALADRRSQEPDGRGTVDRDADD